tara:strand:+ start:27 stop:401 length:375 start_codon:yes stop_codon:yes gene_type:complete
LPVDGKKVVEHRITFGTKERDLLQDLSTSYRIGQVAQPTVDLLKDASALYALAVVYEMITGQDLPLVITPEEAGAFWYDFYTYNKQNRAEKAASATGGTRLLFQDFITNFSRFFSGQMPRPGGD